MSSLSKIRSLSIIFILVFSMVLTACTKDKTEENKKDKIDQNGSIEFSYLLSTRYIDWINDLNWYDELIKRTNANITLTDGGDEENYDSNTDLRISGGNFPDAGIVSLAQAEVYGSQGAFLDLKPLIDKYAPHIKQYIEENPEFKTLATASDGKMYALPLEYPKIARVPFYRKDMFDKVGVTQQPRTIEELTDAFRKLKDFYGKDNKNYYPFSGRDGFLNFIEAFNATDTIENGKVHGIYKSGRNFDIYSPGFKQLVEWYRDLYKEGLVDPEWVTGAATEESWGTKMLTGNSSFSYDFYIRPAYFNLNGGKENDPNYDMKVLPYLLDQNGNQSIAPTYPKYITAEVFVINAKSKDKAKGILSFLDYLYTEEGKTLLGWGVQDVSYKEVNGKKEFIVSYDTETVKPLGEKKWSFLQDQTTFPKPITNEAFAQFNNDMVKEFASELFTDEYVKSYPIIKYSTEQLEERTNLLAKVNEAVLNNLVKFVKGDRSLSEWDNFLDEMEEIGYKKIVEIDQAAYDKMNK